MEYFKSSKFYIIVSLVIGTLLLSVGFSAFSETLTIVPTVEVSPDANTFNVGLSTSNSSIVDGSVSPTITYTSDYYNDKMVEATPATIDNTGEFSTISGLSVTFTEVGQSVTYTFYAYNSGKYPAYLKSVKFNNVEGKSSYKVCEAISGTTSADAEAACANISVNVSIAGTNYSSTNESISGHTLLEELSDTIIVTISYSGDSNSDGDFYVEYGDISILYSSVE